MKYLMDKLNRFRRWFYRKWYTKYTSIIVDDMPDIIKNGVCYIISDDGMPYTVEFRCPCGCGDIMSINLIGSRPVWKLLSSEHSQDITLHPSVHRSIKCKSHYFIKSGKIKWV